MLRKIAIGLAVCSALVAIAAVIATPAPSAAPVAAPVTSEAAAAAEARQFLASSLLDPASARFGHVMVGSLEGHTVICGEVSGRNPLGGMTPMEAFVVVPSQGVVLIQGRDKTDDIVTVWTAACPN